MKWLILALEGKKNPMLVNKTSVKYIIPFAGNELKSVLYIIDDPTGWTINQSTGSIEEQLWKD